MANFEELEKNIGQIFRLRPLPFLVTGYTDNVIPLSTSVSPRRERITQEANYDWQLTAVDRKVMTATLRCVSTGHEVTLNSDDIRDHRKPHDPSVSETDGRPALMLKSRLYMEPDGRVMIDPVA